MIKLIKSDVDEITAFIVSEPKFDTLEIYQPCKGDNCWQLLKVFENIPEGQIAFSVSGVQNFDGYSVDYSNYKIVLKSQGNVVREIQLSPNNFSIPSWKRGIQKLKKQEFLITAKRVNGNKVLVFKKLKAQHCPKCWDEDLQSSNNSNCPLCGGTGYVEKYSLPYFTWGGPYITQPSSYSLGDEQGKDIFNPNNWGQTSITLLPDVLIDVDDLVYVVEDGELNIVRGVTISFFSNIPISQRLIMAPLTSESKEFKAVEQDLKNKLRELNGIR